jgi:hypothetical protein
VHIQRHSIEHSVHVTASVEAVWQQITQVDIASFRHPAYLAMLGIPKPLRAEVLRPGVGGVRIAFFSNNRRFFQEITQWQPPERYAFSFKADPGFRVAYCLDLSDGPFRMVAGSYRLRRTGLGTHLTLSSQYELYGVLGACLGIPVRLVLHRFQIYLLHGLKRNAERGAHNHT